MSKHKHIDAVCIGITAFTLLLTLLFINGKAFDIAAVANEENSGAIFTENDLDAAWDTAGAAEITLSDEGSTVSGNGAYVYNGDIHIVYAGKYVLSGALSDGSVIVEADGDDKIWLMLSGVSIHCEDNAAIRVEQAGKVFMTLQDGTENTLSSGASFGEEAVSASVDGTVYSRDDLTINGSGSLQVTTEYQHGIVCNDDFVVTGGTLNVTAAQDAIHANDSVRLKDADLTLFAGDDGITVSNDEETSFLYVESGKISIPSCCEGLEAVQITIAGGTLDISAADDGINANGYGGNSVISITGGEIAVTVENGRDADGIDSNKDIYISGGKLFVSVSDSGGSCAIDYGSENGGKCEISGGTVLACGSSGMAEGFDSASTQGFLIHTASASAGTTVMVKDADGNELLSEKVPCSFSSVLVSTPEMKVGDTCRLIVGDTETEITIDNASAGGGFGGFGGRGIRGGNGFGGGQMPGRGGFGRNGGAFDGGMAGETQDSESTQDGGTADEAQNSESAQDGGTADETQNSEGTQDGGTADEAQNSEGTQNDSERSVTSAIPAISLLSTAGNEDQDGSAAGETDSSDQQSGDAPAGFPENDAAGGMQPPEIPNGTEGDMQPPEVPNGTEGDMQPPEAPNGEEGDMQPSEVPNGTEGDMQPPEIPNGTEGDMQPSEVPNGAEGDMLSDLPQGNMPDVRTNEDSSDGTQSDIPQGGWNFGEHQGGGNMRNLNGNMPGQENVSQAAAAGTPISAETLILLGVSVIVLLVGCAAAVCYKRRS